MTFPVTGRTAQKATTTSPTGRSKLIVRNTQYGFTLIELALVAMIIVILIGISTPMFRKTYNDMQLNETSYNIVKFMNYGRAMAVTERINTRLNFDFEIGKYWLTVNINPQTTDRFEHIKGRLGRFYSVPSGIEIKGEDEAVDFYPNGRSEDFKIFLKNRNGRERLIEVKGTTGEPEASDIE